MDKNAQCKKHIHTRIVDFRIHIRLSLAFCILAKITYTILQLRHLSDFLNNSFNHIKPLNVCACARARFYFSHPIFPVQFYLIDWHKHTPL